MEMKADGPTIVCVVNGDTAYASVGTSFRPKMADFFTSIDAVEVCEVEMH